MSDDLGLGDAPGPADGDIHVFVPDQYGDLVACNLVQLVEALSDGMGLLEAAGEAGIDVGEPSRAWASRLARLNATGDAHAYWTER